MPSATLAPSRANLLPIVATNLLAVGTIYFVQSLAALSARGAGSHWAASMLPGCPTAGYAIGVAYCATLARDLHSARGFVIHLGFLVGSLAFAAVATTLDARAVALVFVGAGCAVTQRLLSIISNAVSDTERPRAIGAIVAAGLTGVVAARSILVALGSSDRAALLWPVAALLTATGLSAARVARSVQHAPPTIDRPPVLAAWRQHGTVRSAALQMSLVFACYNFSWVTTLRHLGSSNMSTAAVLAMISGAGAGAALLAGRAVARTTHVERWGLAAAAFGAVASHAAWWLGGWAWVVPMLVMDIGTQMALVANQARAQAVSSDRATRGRLAAIVTTVGFAGGAAGAALAWMP